MLINFDKKYGVICSQLAADQPTCIDFHYDFYLFQINIKSENVWCSAEAEAKADSHRHLVTEGTLDIGQCCPQVNKLLK